jgi:hypothetical protein
MIRLVVTARVFTAGWIQQIEQNLAEWFRLQDYSRIQ